MIFGNRFEQALLNKYIVSPFNGYSIDKNTSFFDLLCDFCSSVAHNGIVFPEGISKQNQVRVFYASYSLGIMLSCSNNESHTDQISSGAVKAFANTAKQNGMNQQMIMERLTYVLNCFDAIGKAVDNGAPEKQGAYAAIEFLCLVGSKPTVEKISAIYAVFTNFSSAYDKWDKITG